MRATHMDTHLGEKTFEVRCGHHRRFNHCFANAITQNSNSFVSFSVQNMQKEIQDSCNISYSHETSYRREEL